MGYGVAFIGGVVGQIGGLLSNHVAQMIGTVVSFLVPSDLLFRGGLHGLAPSIPTELAGIVQAGPFGNASPVSGPMLVYCFGYPVVALTAACWLFSRKDL
jgi:ABC-type transport system involved in multi-copper enzyme maturation permease subunit